MNPAVEERVAKNDATFRFANEAIAMKADAVGAEDPIPFLCECAIEDCAEVILMSRAEYEDVRRDPTHFVNAPGHPERVPVGLEVVAETDRYVVVEKPGLAAEIAEELDPR